MKEITKEYIILIEELKQKVLENDIIEILNVFDKIKLFWNKHKLFIVNKLSNKKYESAIIGCMTYPHFSEKHYFIPLANNELLIIDEPISKMDKIIRASSINNAKKMVEILKRTVEVFIKNKDTIINNNIVIVPLELYYGLDSNTLRPQADKLVYSALSYMFNKKIENENDIESLSIEYNSFERIDDFIEKSKRDVLFLGTDLVELPVSKRIEQYYKNSGLDFNKIVNIQSPIYLIITSIYGYSAQIIDIINICENTNSDLYLFIEIPAFYFNILLENIFTSDSEIYNKYLKTLIGYYLEKYLKYHNYGDLTLEQFCCKYKSNNLIELVFEDFINNGCSKSPTDIKSIKKFIENRVAKFLGT